MSVKNRGWYNIYSLSCLILAAIGIYIVWYYYIGTEQPDWIIFASAHKNNTGHVYISEDIQIEKNITVTYQKKRSILPSKNPIKPPTSPPSKRPTKTIIPPSKRPTKSITTAPSKNPTVPPSKKPIKSPKRHIPQNCSFQINDNSSMVWCRQNMNSFGKTPLQIWLSETLNFANWYHYFRTLFCDYNIDDISTVCSISEECLKETFKITNTKHRHDIIHSCKQRKLSLNNWNKTIKKLIILSYATIGDSTLLNKTLICDMMKINALNNISIEYMGNTQTKRMKHLINKVIFLQNKLIELSNIYNKTEEADKILILFVDGTDVYITANTEQIIQKWISMNVANYVLFSAERFGMFVGRYTRPKWPKSPYYSNEDYRWLNSGGFIGSLSTVYKLVNIDLNYLRNENTEYIFNNRTMYGVDTRLGWDQYWYSLLYFQNYDKQIVDTNNEQNHHQIVVDYKGELFMSICQNAVNGKLMGNESGIYYNVTNVKPLIVHFNGFSSSNANTAYNILHINKYLSNLKTTYSNYRMIFNDTIIQNDDIFKKTVSLNQLCPYWFGNSMKQQFQIYGYAIKRHQKLC